MINSNGGYDDGYRTCPCFWGREPSRLVIALRDRIGSFRDLRALDAGCGEGKNTAYMSADGCSVLAVDISPTAIANGQAAWPDLKSVEWQVADVCQMSLMDSHYDVVVAYGLLHCLTTATQVTRTVHHFQRATKPGGYHVICTFNDRAQDLRAHPGLEPTLLSHDFYLGLYADWLVISATDEDLSEIHPNNSITHSHSMTRMLVQRKQ
jgi:tellurite methyltransferase